MSLNAFESNLLGGLSINNNNDSDKLIYANFMIFCVKIIWIKLTQAFSKTILFN